MSFGCVVEWAGCYLVGWRVLRREFYIEVREVLVFDGFEGEDVLEEEIG